MCVCVCMYVRILGEQKSTRIFSLRMASIDTLAKLASSSSSSFSSSLGLCSISSTNRN